MQKIKNLPNPFAVKKKGETKKQSKSRAELHKKCDDLHTVISSAFNQLEISKPDKENSSRLSNGEKEAAKKPNRCKNTHFSSNPFLLDSQRKTFIGDTVSEMKRKIKSKVKSYYGSVDDEQAVVEYADQIHHKLVVKSARFSDYVNHDMKNRNKDKHEYAKFEKYRQILIDFMTYFHMVCKIKDDNTLFLAVQILDRYLTRVRVPSKSLQLVGCACLLIAEKYEEIYPNANQTYATLSANSFTVKQLQATERVVCKELSFVLGPFPTLYVLLTQFAVLMKISDQELSFANMLVHI